MQYTIAYGTSVGALTLTAHSEREALQRARGLAKQGYSRVEIIDSDGRRHEIGEFERSFAPSGAGSETNPTRH